MPAYAVSSFGRVRMSKGVTHTPKPCATWYVLVCVSVERIISFTECSHS